MKSHGRMHARLILVFLGIVLTVSARAEVKYALLVGIDNYAPQGSHIRPPELPPVNEKFYDPGGSRWDLPTWPNLSGAVNDVKAMQALLTSRKFAFPNDLGHMDVLTNTQATRAVILGAMQKYLVDLPSRGDTAVFYYAGHGSQRRNSKTDKPDKLDETIVPSDANTGEYDIRDKEIARILNKALDKGIHVTAIFDSCHSGTIARGIPMGSAGSARFLGYDPRDAADPSDTRPDGTAVPRPEDRNDNAALVFTATQHDQLARESKFEDEDHGAFTVALIEALNALSANSPARDVYKRVKVVMQGMELADQQPVLGGTEARQSNPLFGAGSSSSRFTVAVAPEGVLRDGRVVLDAGVVSGLGRGSELVKIGEGNDAASLHLRVAELVDLNKSIAEVLTPRAAIQPGDLFRLEKWAPASRSRLQVWKPPATLSSRDLEEFAGELAALRESRKLTWVDDPVVMPPTHVLSWDGSSWKLTTTGGGSKVLGPRPTSVQIVESAGSAARLFVNLPLTKEMAAQLNMGDHLTIQSAHSPGLARYLLVGRLQGSSVEYAWVRRDVISDAKTSPVVGASTGPVCSPDSPYPSRTDWIDAHSRSADEDLSDFAVRLARVHAWLNLPQPPAGGEIAFPYRLTLKKRDSAKELYVDSGTVAENEEYDLVLRSDGPVPVSTARQWVYVLGIDCSGAGKLLYPSATTAEGNLKPDRGKFDQEISLTGSGTPVRIMPPFGIDTYILLTTSDQLADPSVLNFQSATTRGSRGSPSPLEDLLGSASAGMRGMDRPIPSDWSLQTLEIHSVPNRK